MLRHAVYFDRLAFVSTNNTAEIPIHFILPRMGDQRQMVFGTKDNMKIELRVGHSVMPRVSHAGVYFEFTTGSVSLHL